MGVPKFFRYMSERYPCLSEMLKDYQIPEFDNLYLDMNGIIHVCSHSNNNHISFHITEEEIFNNIFHYVEVLFSMIRPQRLFFIAIDGVAPRAKINQQRARRFKAAKEAKMQEARAIAKGIEIKGKPFDSNCITPGTVFMAKLNKQLRYFIIYKVSTDKLWQKCKVLFSGSEVPGEGEHKIMDYIRYLKSQPGYDYNTRHCLYGLDADLIMLGLCTHERNFSLLREEVKFSKKQNKILTPEETKFCLLHLSLLREYLNHEFSPVKGKLSFPFDIERIIDDWVLMGFLVGNDFIPNLPNLHIGDGALTILYHAYMKILPTLGGYINESGTLRLDRFEVFMEQLSHIDIKHFELLYCDLKYLKAKLSKYKNAENEEEISQSDEESSRNCSPSIKVENLPKFYTDMQDADTEEKMKDTSDIASDDESDSYTYNTEFLLYKRDYYITKLKYEDVNEDVLRSQAEGYVKAIQWNLNYYYNGCCSWSWYYPHHYAPYISDIKGFKDLKLEFELGEPFLPFQQLLAALPPYSKDLLPEAFQTLLTDTESPIIDYYPSEFKIDLNGKKQDWEGVVLIPFINEETLLGAMEPYYSKLTPEEQTRNKHGPMYLYSYTKESLGLHHTIYRNLPPIENYAEVQEIKREDIYVPKEKLVKGLHPDVNLNMHCPGFPTLKHIPHIAVVEKAKVKVFEQPSKHKSMILYIQKQNEPHLTELVTLLHNTIYVEWPFLREATVVGVSDRKCKINLINPRLGYTPENIEREELKGALATQWNLKKTSISETYKTRFGIDVGETDILIHAQPLIGSKYVFTELGKLSLEKQWQEPPSVYAYQTIVKDISTYPIYSLLYKTIDEIFLPGSTCFMLGHPHYGAMGEVIESKVNSGRIKISVKVTSEPDLSALKQAHLESKKQYIYGNIAAQRLGIKSNLLSRISGSIYIIPKNSSDIVNVGLNLKFNKKNKEIPGYTRKENSQWLYSTKAINLVRDYMTKCPNLFERFSKNMSKELLYEDDLFDSTTNELSTTVAWLKEQHFHSIESRPHGSNIVDVDVVQRIEKEVDTYYKTYSRSNKTIVMQVKPHLIFKPELHSRQIELDPKCNTKLLDRIICIRGSFTVPLGFKGTIIGIQKTEESVNTLYDVLFDKPFLGGIALDGCSECRGYKLAVTDFINISYGERIERGRSGIETASTETTESWRRRPNTNNQTYNNANPVAFDNPCAVPTASNASKQRLHQRQYPWSVETHNEKIPAIQHKPSYELQQASKKLPSEFQLLWNDLHKTEYSSAPLKAPVTTFVGPNEIRKQQGNERASQDPSAFLKEVLKISDDNAKTNLPTESSGTSASKAQSQIHKTSDAPPLVQKLFDYARQQRVKIKNDKHSNWYCSQLLNYYQMLGVGLPRYEYIFDVHTNKIKAEILLSDGTVRFGDPCSTSVEAAESAARKVYEELNLDKTQKPEMKILLKPPLQQWVNTPQNNSCQYMGPSYIPELYPPSENPMPHCTKWNTCGIKMMQNEGRPHIPPPHLYNNQMQVQTRQKTDETKSVVKNSTPFVPLQAQKKSRNVGTKQANKEATQNNPANNTQQTKQPVRQHEKKVLTKLEQSSNKTIEKEVCVQSNLQSSTKLQKSGRAKRSRVAAKFVSPPATNESEKN